MWESILQFGEEAFDAVAEGAGQYVDHWVQTKTQVEQERNTDPRLLTQLEPTKGTRTDGSPRLAVVEEPQIMGFDRDKVIMVGGGLLFTGVLIWALTHSGGK